jgi:hypothetical protein
MSTTVSTYQVDSKYVPNYGFQCEGLLIAGSKVSKVKMYDSCI